MNNADKVTDKVLEVITQLQSVATDATHQAVNHLPDVVNLGLAAIRVDGLSDIVAGLILLLVCFISAKGLLYLRKKGFSDETETLAIGISSVTCLCVAIIPMFVLLFNVWTYVKIFEPKVYLAHKVMEKVMEGKNG